MESVLSRCLLPTDQMIKNLVEIELGYINTNHPDFVGGTNMLLNMVRNGEESQRSEILFTEEKKENKLPQERERHASVKSQQIKE